MTDEEVLKRISGLDPTQFENLTFDLVRSCGLRNLVWRTPGADGGRDIEGEFTIQDLSGYDRKQKWYVECKRYSNAVDWPTVWKKVSFADVDSADFLLMVTNSSLSPQCETKVNEWNSSHRSPQIRVWRGYNLPALLKVNGDIAQAYGLVDGEDETGNTVAKFALTLTKLVQSANGAMAFDGQPQCALTAANALSELLVHRLQDVEQHGKFVHGHTLGDCKDWPWLQLEGGIPEVEEVGFRAIVALLRFLSNASTVTVCERDEYIEMKTDVSIGDANFLEQQSLISVLPWVRCDLIHRADDHRIFFSLWG